MTFFPQEYTGILGLKPPTVVNLAKESLALPALSILGSEARRLLILGGVIGGASDLGLGVGVAK